MENKQPQQNIKLPASLSNHSKQVQKLVLDMDDAYDALLKAYQASQQENKALKAELERKKQKPRPVSMKGKK